VIYILPSIIYLAVTPILNEPLNLVRSLILALSCILLLILKPELLSIQRRIYLLLLFVPALYVVSAIVNSQNPILALIGNYNRNFGVLTYAAIAILFLIGLNSNFSLDKFISISISQMYFLILIYGYIQISGLDPLQWSEPDRVVLTLGNSNFAASFIGMFIAYPIYKFIKAPKMYMKLFYFILFAATIYLGIKTISFQFRVVSIISLLVFILFYKIPFLKQVTLWKKIIGTLTTILSSLVYVVMQKDAIIAMSNFNDRISQQIMGLRIFIDHPFFGVGADQLWRYSPMYLSSRDIVINGSNVVPDKTHNVLVDHLANGGIFVGIAVLVFLSYSTFVIYSLAVKYDLNSNERIKLALASSIWTAYLVQLFINTDSIVILVIPYLLVGFIFRQYYSIRSINLQSAKKSPDKSFNIITRLLSLVIIIPLVFFSFKAIDVDKKTKEFLTGKRLYSSEELINHIREWPNPKTTEIIAVLASTEIRNCPFIEQASEELIKIDTRSGQGWYLKGFCAQKGLRYEEALNFYEKALVFQPKNTWYLESKFKLEIDLKRFKEAAVTIEKLKLINPGYSNLEELNRLLF
jgi:hypothetical protein